MKQILLFIMAVLASVQPIPAEEVQLYYLKDAGIEYKYHCVYRDQHLYFMGLENNNGEYSSVWKNCLKASPVNYINSIYFGTLSYPDVMVYEGEEYRCVALGKILLRSFGVTAVNLPYELRFIDRNALSEVNEWNPDLVSISLPPAIHWIGSEAFNNNGNMTDITCLAPLPPLCESDEGEIIGTGTIEMTGEGPFFGTAPNCSLNIPEGSLYFYRDNIIFSQFKDLHEIPADEVWQTHSAIVDGVQLNMAYVGNGEVVILGASSLTEASSLNLPSKVNLNGLPCIVTAIGPGAFENSPVKSVTLPETIKLISGNAFKGSSIRELTLPSGCLYAGYQAFADMKNLKRVRIMATKQPFFARDAFAGITSGVKLETVISFDTKDLPWSAFSSIEVLPPSGVETIDAVNPDETKYSLQGLPVDNPRKGEIVIVNGKKYVNR